MVSEEMRRLIVEQCNELANLANLIGIAIGDSFSDSEMLDRDDLCRKMTDARDDARFIAGRVSGEIEYD